MRSAPRRQYPEGASLGAHGGGAQPGRPCMNFGTVLVVEDEIVLRRYIATILETHANQVKGAASAEDGLELLGESSFDIVLVDLGLPGMDGREFIRRVRSWSAMPIIVLTSLEATETKVSALDAGADDYLTKPFAPQEPVPRTRAGGR